jgi:hypothetical protein
MRVAVVDSGGAALMPCTPGKTRHLLKNGKAKPKRNKLGIFYVQLCYEQEPNNQPMVVGVDPGGKWNGAFSPIQVGKDHLYWLLRAMGLSVHLKEGWQTKELREKHGLKKTKSKSQRSFDSHTVDSWVLAASVSGASFPTCTRVWYVVPAILHRRQLHRLQAEKGDKRKPYGGTRSLTLKRGTLVRHPRYGLCTVGGFDRHKQAISLHAYTTNKRLTQAAKVEHCRILTWVAFRSWLVTASETLEKKQATPPTSRNAECLFPPAAVIGRRVSTGG